MKNEEKKLNWEYIKLQKWLEILKEQKKGFERLIFNSDNGGHYCIGKSHTEIEHLAVTIWRDGKLNFTFSSVNNKDSAMYAIIKHENKLLLVDDKSEIHAYGFENDNSNFHETAMIIYSSDCETNIILASNKSTKLERLTTFYDINSETTEQFITNFVKNKTEGEVKDSDEISTKSGFDAESFE